MQPPPPRSAIAPCLARAVVPQRLAAALLANRLALAPRALKPRLTSCVATALAVFALSLGLLAAAEPARAAGEGAGIVLTPDGQSLTTQAQQWIRDYSPAEDARWRSFSEEDNEAWKGGLTGRYLPKLAQVLPIDTGNLAKAEVCSAFVTAGCWLFRRNDGPIAGLQATPQWESLYFGRPSEKGAWDAWTYRELYGWDGREFMYTKANVTWARPGTPTTTATARTHPPGARRFARSSPTSPRAGIRLRMSTTSTRFSEASRSTRASTSSPRRRTTRTSRTGPRARTSTRRSRTGPTGRS